MNGSVTRWAIAIAGFALMGVTSHVNAERAKASLARACHSHSPTTSVGCTKEGQTQTAGPQPQGGPVAVQPRDSNPAARMAATDTTSHTLVIWGGSSPSGETVPTR